MRCFDDGNALGGRIAHPPLGGTARRLCVTDLGIAERVGMTGKSPSRLRLQPPAYNLSARSKLGPLVNSLLPAL